MGAAETRKKNLPDKRILSKKIDANMILISNINIKIQDFISVSYSFEDEEQIDKIRSKIINEYKILRASKIKIISACELLPQDDIEFTNLYKTYNIEITSLTQRYKKIIKGSLLGSKTLAMICYTNANGLSLYTYDLQDHTSRCFPSKIFQEGACTITLPNSQLFIYSPGYTYLLEISNLLDLKSSIKTKIPTNFNYLYSGGIYYKNSVYLFGGASYHGHCGAVRRFDLEKNLWYRLAPLPEASRECASTVFKDSILICGVSHEKIYKYDLNTASYSRINNVTVKEQSHKVLFKAGSRVYFLVWCGGIFESELENEYTYTCIGKSDLAWGSVEQITYYNHSVCFITGGWRKFQIFKFDLSTKMVILIKK